MHEKKESIIIVFKTSTCDKPIQYTENRSDGLLNHLDQGLCIIDTFLEQSISEQPSFMIEPFGNQPYKSMVGAILKTFSILQLLLLLI